ncbi:MULTISPECIES: SiaB family protein kinase [Kosakonia]|uniref:SiaB family protein kinase n=1 Tax=Kosakonia TaxID=1330547 RepID=UPI00201E724D|nr:MULTISPECIES: SiaB family protein kinase [Kosakonia]MCL6744670.1 SiaB family protein kinase [Kosakonia sp. R1.Fl]MDZ7324566.1 SiaB family protein kinase [Kosakonia sacchari]
MQINDLQVKEAVLLPLFTLQRQNAVELFYTGYFSQQHIVSLGEVIRTWLDKHESSAVTRRKLFSAFIEMGQNIVRYSSDDRYLSTEQQELRFGSVCFHMDQTHYYLETANLVGPEASTLLQTNLDVLRGMSQAEIRDAWKQGLRSEAPVTSKGANIGLLTMARDTSLPLEYRIHPLAASSLSAFHLKATFCHD